MVSQSESTGVTFPWEQIAMDGGEMPEGLNAPGQGLFQNLRLLYKQYREGVISRDAAVREKKEMVRTYELEMFYERMGEEFVWIIKHTEVARAEYRKNPCHENAMKLIEIIEGRRS